MRLTQVIIVNFRAYREATSIPIDPNITGITGRNDAGKSSVLEALDIFFDGGEVSLDKDDFNVFDRGHPIEISCLFDELPDSIVVDETNHTTLSDEFLLTSDGRLHVLKRYKSPTSVAVCLLAHHPTADGYSDLHSLKITDLRKRAKELGVDESTVEDARTSAGWRKAIWARAPDLKLATCELEIGKFAKESKAMQDKLFSYFPLFALFQSDRESKDNDPYAKNPLQQAVKQAQQEFRQEIDDLQAKIQERVVDRARATIDKLRDMDPLLADKLFPRFKTPPKWTFDFSLDGDDDIPVNKRGSGVRRLILLNFFRAEAERRVADRNAPSVIYAIEEPETSQHPNNQELLIRSLKKLGGREKCQIIVTTHVPALAGLLPVEGLRLLEQSPNGVEANFGSDDVLDKISQSLGVIPEKGVTRAKALILVEGPSDVVFLRHAAQALKNAGHLPSTLEERSIFPVAVGGCGTLKHWVTKRIADQFNIPWGVLLDSDLGTPEESHNRQTAADISSKGKKVYLTRRREAENYIHPDVVRPHLKSNALLGYSDTDDAKEIIARAVMKRKEMVLETFWPMMSPQQIRQVEQYTDANGEQRFEITEMLRDFLTLV
jgi:hypothetical protein